MIFEHTEIFNFDGAIRGMRNPYNSWAKSDTGYYADEAPTGSFLDYDYDTNCKKIIGTDDLVLMQKLIKAGSEHRKFLRQIIISVDITAPIYWWKEFDTYKVGTVANSTSTMHKLASTPITLDCFEFGDFNNLIIGDAEFKEFWQFLIGKLEYLRNKYNETKDIKYWKELIRILPESWLQKRTITLNYENVLSMIRQRKGHKLTEWRVDFMEWASTLPYAQELLFIGK